MTNIRLGVIQPSLIPYDFHHNLEVLALQLRRLQKQGVNLAVLPEFFPTGNTLEPEMLRVAIQSSATVRDWLAEQTRALRIIIAGAYLSFEGGDVYNKFVIHEPDGSISYHFKTFSPVTESIYYRVSSEKKYIVETSLGKIGLITCVEMMYPQIVRADYSECSLLLIAFAIPNSWIMSPVLRRLISVPRAIAKRNGIPVILCSTGGNFFSNGSPVLPLKMKGLYAGKSGIYLPSGSIADPLSPGEKGVLVADIPLGPGVDPPDTSVKIKAGLPLFMRLFDLFLKKKAEKLYETNLKQWRH